MSELTPEQQAAVDARQGSVLLSAGAGTGKTTVLVERFVRAVVDDGVAVEAILAITFTEKAAAQLKQRVRARLLQLGERAAARDTEAAWISTIHGFCARILRTHALAAGIDPEFRVLDAVESERLAIDAFDRALAEFVGEGGDEERVEMLAAYKADRVATMVRSAYGHLRSQGNRRPRLAEMERPRPAGEREALAATIDPALAEIGPPPNPTSEKACGALGRCRELLGAGGPVELATLDRVTIQSNAKALKGPSCDAYRDALAAYRQHVERTAEYRSHRLIRELVALYDEQFAGLKRERSGLDFDDLELMARDLLRGDAAVRERYAERFAHVMVDEFQDTNPLQNEILELIERAGESANATATGPSVFRVGDERQSIYRFRHADVEVFRAHRCTAVAQGRERRITTNFRSRGEVLDAVDLVFSDLWGEGFIPLVEAPGARSQPPRAQPCIELLVTDLEKGRWDESVVSDGEAPPFGEAMRNATPWRAAEARLLARRMAQLVGPDGPFEASDAVVLVRATTNIGLYERALEEQGVPTHVLGGRGYWGQQQVADLRAYLATLANPMDELSLECVLASPLVGVSLDALVLIARCARASGSDWDVWRTLSAIADDARHPRIEQLVGSLRESDRARVRTFVGRLRAAREQAPRLSLEEVIDDAVTESGYDRAVLALPAGDRRLANVRKLMRMAREFEAEEGRDLRAFVDFAAERDLITERQGEAPLDAEDVDAVRLMTVHRAKGLEFPLVALADLGKSGRENQDELRIADDGRMGMRLASLRGGSVKTAALKEIAEEQKLADEEEERRIFYVALTRAEQHLILSGATDLEKLPAPGPLDEPMRWLWRVLAPDLDDRRDETAFISTTSYAGRPVDVRCEVLRPEHADAVLPAADRSPLPEEQGPAGLEALAAPALASVAIPPALPISRLSYSSLERYRRCGYRFYLERALQLPRADTELEDEDHGATAEEADRLPAVIRGSVVHQLLERLDLSAPQVPDSDAVAAVIEAARQPVRDADVADLLDMVRRFLDSPLATRLASAQRADLELPFSFSLSPEGERRRSSQGLLLTGVVDVLAREADGRMLVVDYKSNRLEGADPAELTERFYSTQRTVYALAALAAGATEVEVVYTYLERPLEPVTGKFTAADAPALEAELRSLALGVLERRFDPAAEPHRELCGDCPGRARLCSWDEQMTMRPPPEPTGSGAP